jgi:hypothetical protein
MTKYPITALLFACSLPAAADYAPRNCSTA